MAFCLFDAASLSSVPFNHGCPALWLLLGISQWTSDQSVYIYVLLLIFSFLSLFPPFCRIYQPRATDLILRSALYISIRFSRCHSSSTDKQQRRRNRSSVRAVYSVYSIYIATGAFVRPNEFLCACYCYYGSGCTLHYINTQLHIRHIACEIVERGASAALNADQVSISTLAAVRVNHYYEYI